MSEQMFDVTAGSGFNLTQTLFIELVAHLVKRGAVDAKVLSENLHSAADESSQDGQDPAVTAALAAMAKALEEIFVQKPLS